MILKQQMKLNFQDVLIEPKRSTLNSRKDVDLIREHKFPHSSYIYKGTPIFASNMDGVGSFQMAKVLAEYKLFTVINKHYCFEDWEAWFKTKDDDRDSHIPLKARAHLAVSTGTNYIHDKEAQDYALVKRLMEKWNELTYICIDVANAYNENVATFVSQVRNDFPTKVIIVGNVCTPEMTEQLIISGADIVKVGIGSGAVCTTRSMTGVGYPQLSATIECADAAHGLNGKIISDGGCTCPGDVVKAFGGGADFVMLGGMLAGHDEGMVSLKKSGVTTTPFYGMSSDYAMEIHGARKDGYRGSEGRYIEIPRRGLVAATVEEILGGLRSACTYIGARRVKDIPKCTTFVRTTQQLNMSLSEYF